METRALKTKFQYLKTNLATMAEITLEQVLDLNDSLERENYELAQTIIERDTQIDQLEKENDNISQTAILEAVASRNAMGMEQFEPGMVLKNDPLRFALSAIRITRHLERMGDNVVNAAHSFRNGKIKSGVFNEETSFKLTLNRMSTIVGMAVESLVEEKNRFFGSMERVDAELDLHSQNSFQWLIRQQDLAPLEFADLYRIVISLERIGDLAVNVGEELVRLATGVDIRYRFESDKKNPIMAGGE